jgi:predicted N-formylglutamate amidohydrolase
LFLKPLALFLTCEHAVPRIPAEVNELFSGHQPLLDSHRGFDAGALNLAEYLSRHLKAPIHRSEYSRLLVDLNRSIGHPELFSVVTKPLDQKKKTRILNQYYLPYRNRISRAISGIIQTGRTVLHISVHSFTPIFKGRMRKTDIGLLFDPDRGSEKDFCETWRRYLRKGFPGREIHFNLPYRGISDGLTSHFRKRWTDECYCGIELEVNQKYFLAEAQATLNLFSDKILQALSRTISELTLG